VQPRHQRSGGESEGHDDGERAQGWNPPGERECAEKRRQSQQRRSCREETQACRELADYVGCGPAEPVHDVAAPDRFLNVEMDGGRAEHNPFGGREVPDERFWIGRHRHSGFGNRSPQAREHAQDDRKEHDAAVQLTALPARLSDRDPRKRRVLDDERHHDDALPVSAFAYKARITSSSGASSMAMSLIAA